jgi:hypothetical protein
LCSCSESYACLFFGATFIFLNLFFFVLRPLDQAALSGAGSSTKLFLIGGRTIELYPTDQTLKNFFVLNSIRHPGALSSIATSP